VSGRLIAVNRLLWIFDDILCGPALPFEMRLGFSLVMLRAMCGL
jgi:hypothetical protein